MLLSLHFSCSPRNLLDEWGSLPPICAFCCCLLLPKYRQFGMTIGELCWFLVRLDLDLGNKISPLIRARGAVYNHLFLFLRGLWSLLWAVFPVPMSPHHIIGMHCSSWCCGRWKIITSLHNHFECRRQDSLLYLDQSAVQIINVIRRYRQRPRRVLLQRAIESLD